MNAFNVVKSIYERAQILEDFPLAGQAYRSASNRELRTLLWGHYRIVYLVRPDDEVHIVGVFHGAMRLEN
jgi:toxin ParE1/3/4